MRKNKEYKNHIDRLQMSLFSTLYHKARGYIIVPSTVFSNLENTEWGKLDNFRKTMGIIEDEYSNEANETLNSWVDVETRHYIISGGDYAPVASRFYDTEDRNGNLLYGAKSITDSYQDFVLKVGKKLGLDFKPNFSYFA